MAKKRNSPTSLDSLLEERLESLRHVFLAGNEGALVEALCLCTREDEFRRVCRQELFGGEAISMPAWLVDAVSERLVIYLSDFLVTGKGRNAKWASRNRQDMIDYARWDAVRELRDNPETRVPWTDGKVYRAAAKLLEGTPAGGAEQTIRGSYFKVTRNMKSNPERYRIFKYLTIPSLG